MARPRTRKPQSRRPHLLLFLLVAAFILKALVVARFYDHPLLQPTSDDLDSAVYARLASHVAAGDVLLRGEGAVPYFVSPLYVYFLALVHVVSGGSLLAARLAQILLGTAAVGLLFGAVRRFSSERAAAFAAASLALTGTVTFHEIVILQSALDPFLTALSLWLAARALTRGEEEPRARVLRAFALAGLAFGLFALNRPNALLPAAALAALLPLVEGFRRGVPRAAALGAGVVLALSPVTFRNLAVSGEPVLVSSHGGLNFYIGNNEKADGTYHHVEGITPSIEGQARDSRALAEAALGRKLTTSEVSRYFTAKAFTWMREQPRDAARLFLRKLAFTVNREEITLDYSYAYYSREESSALKLLFLGAGLLVPLGIVGLAVRAASPPRTAFLVWASFVPVYLVSVAAFFVSARYRLPLLLPLAAGTGLLADRAGAWLASRAWKPLAVAAAALIPLFVLANWDFHLDDGSDREKQQHVILLIERKDYAEARRRIELLAPRLKEPAVLHYRVGLALQYQNLHGDAVAAFRQALSLDPGRREIQLSMAASEEKLALEHVLAGRREEGMRELEEACRLDPGEASARQNLAALYAEAGRFDEARALAEEALRLNPGYPQAKALLEALSRRGK